jgi:cyclase
MLLPRIIPCLLVKNGGLVKTIKFGSPKYVGDPINAVKIFNEKEVDELIVLDIDSSLLNKEPNYDLIKNLAVECRMPLCYGGGVKTSNQVERIIGLGVEKVAISSAAVESPEVVQQASENCGSQSVVVVIDVMKSRWGARYEVLTHNAKKRTRLHPVDFAKKVQKSGAGEVVINSIDRDGTMEGYDFALVDEVRKAITIPMTALGGAGSLDSIGQLIGSFGIIGAAAGSLFVFKGKYRAVLINYPDNNEKEKLISRYYQKEFAKDRAQSL